VPTTEQEQFSLRAAAAQLEPGRPPALPKQLVSGFGVWDVQLVALALALLMLWPFLFDTSVIAAVGVLCCAVAVGVVAVRRVRAGVFLTREALVIRRGLRTLDIGWRDLADVSFPGGTAAELLLRDGARHAVRELSRTPAYDGAALRPDLVELVRVWQPPADPGTTLGP
jgi:hypothetical protein